MMTKKETIVLLGYMKIAYPHMFKDTDAEYTGNVWHEMICDEDISLARIALKKHIASSEYPPTIAEFLKLIENEKWDIYSEHLFSEHPKKLHNYYVPRSITQYPKQFELKSKKVINQNIAQKALKLIISR